VAARDDSDSDDIRILARNAYVQAAERAEAVGGLEAAESAYLRAAELSPDETEQAEFTSLAGRMAALAGWSERATGHLDTAIAVYAKAGRVVDAARVIAQLGPVLSILGRGEQAITRVRESLASLTGVLAPPEVVADLQAGLGRALLFSGQVAAASGPVDEALTLAQHHELAEPLADSLHLKALLLYIAGRAEEAGALHELSVAVARRHGITRSEMLGEASLADFCMSRDLPGAEEHAEAALALARRWGLRRNEAFAASDLMYIVSIAGRLEEARLLGTGLLKAGGDERPGAAHIHYRLAYLEALRGDVNTGRDHLAGCQAWAESDSVQDRACYATVEAAISLAGGDSPQALETARCAIDGALSGGLAISHESLRIAFPVAIEAAIDGGKLDEADQLVGLLATRPRGEVPPFLRAQVTRAKALIASARGADEAVEENFVAAESALKDLGYPYWVARTQLERAQWLALHERLDESAELAAEASNTFETMGVLPTLGRSRVLLEPDVVRSFRGVESPTRA
jgi:tetratricopeptide (TPR) repeat protein